MVLGSVAVRIGVVLLVEGRPSSSFTFSFTFSSVRALVGFMSFLVADEAPVSFGSYPRDLVLYEEVLTVAEECLRIPFEVSENLLECCLS